MLSNAAVREALRSHRYGNASMRRYAPAYFRRPPVINFALAVRRGSLSKFRTALAIAWTSRQVGPRLGGGPRVQSSTSRSAAALWIARLCARWAGVQWAQGQVYAPRAGNQSCSHPPRTPLDAAPAHMTLEATFPRAPQARQATARCLSHPFVCIHVPHHRHVHCAAVPRLVC